MTKANLTVAARCRLLALVGALGALLASVQAQTAPAASPAASAAKKDEAIILTPFQVSTDKDNGYAAGNTLSGGRADTPLKITSASISVMTKEFLEDFAIIDMNEAAAWTIGMNAPTGGENGPFGGNRFQADFRGAGNGANYPSRNGALEYFVADSYNSERFEFSRGPNAALFGDAGPGGMQGSSSKLARLNDRRSSASFRIDSYGGYRATIDTAYGLERFALRVNGLRQDTKAYQDGTSNKENAVTLAATYKIAANTQLRVEYQRTHEWQIEYRTTYAENASVWNGTTVNNDNSAINGNAGLGAFGIGQINATNDTLTWNTSTNSLINYRGNQYRTVGLGFAIPWGGRPDLPNFKSGVSKRFNLGPGDAAFQRDLNSRSINLDHRFNPNLFFNVAWISSDIDPVALYSQGVPNDYRIDINRQLPSATGTGPGAANPNFGKAYADFGQNSQYQSNNVNEFRFNGTYNFDVPKLFQMKQRFLVNGGWRQDLYEAWNRAWRRTDNPAQLNPTNAVNTLNFRVYWDQPRPNIAPVLSGSGNKTTIGGMAFQNVDTGFAADNNRRLTYGQIVSQTSFFDERVGVTLSFRRDKNQDDVSGNIGFDPTGYQIIMGAQNPKTLINEAGRRGVLTTFRNSQNAGVVAYPFPASWGRWVAPIGVVANYSQNFSIPSTGANFITGERPSPPVATTKDFGLRYSMPNGVAYATLSHYNTEQIGNIATFGSATDFQNIWRNLGYTEPDLISTFSYRDSNDRKLEGWEVEVTANPSRNLTFTTSYSHPIVTTISDSPGRRKYYADNLAQFTAGSKAVAGTVLNGHTILDPAVIAQSMLNIENSFNGFTPGTLANNLERHRVNVAGSYRFTEGVMKGFAVNAGVNYRAHKKVGSRDAPLKFGTTAPTVLQTAQAAYDYLWVAPMWYTTAGANYTHRIGKYTARFQVNIANLLDNEKTQWSSYSVISAGQLQGVQGVPTNALTVAGGNPRMQVLSGFNQFGPLTLAPRKITFTTSVNF